MKKVLFVIDSLNSGGAEKSLITLLTLFDYKRFQVDLLLFSKSGLYLSLLPREVNVINAPNYFEKQSMGVKGYIKNKDFKGLYIKMRNSLALRNPYNKSKMHGSQISWIWASRCIKPLKDEYDIAIAYSQGFPTYFVANKVNATKKLSWVNIDYRLASYNKDYDLKFYKEFNNIIAVSDSCKDILINELSSVKSKVNVVYDIISPTIVKSMSNIGKGFDDDFEGLRILTIGRLVYQKGYEMAIEACYLLKQAGYNIRWYAIGEGDLKYNLKKLIKFYSLEDTFIFLGTFQNPYPFLKQCDLYVQPSRFEGYGLAIAEARILQKPIVATNFNVIKNQIRHQENGLIVNMNSKSLFNGIREIIEDINLREKVCKNLGIEEVGTESEIEKIYSLINF